MGMIDELGLHVTDLSPAKFAAGQAVFRAGDPGANAYLVVKGEIEISAKNAHGERVVLAKFGKGKIFGEMAVLNGSPRTADAVATTETLCAVIDNAVVTRRLKSLDPYMRFWIQFMTERLIELSRRTHV
ncbi:MAG: cyclic nucleotide-binding domain-containing protein [Alphaproteobacteria bacterium]|nr:cyclic nucleotide-binding domain-containing protein [Alphaproteobacteria bacterium]